MHFTDRQCVHANEMALCEMLFVSISTSIQEKKETADQKTGARRTQRARRPDRRRRDANGANPPLRMT